MTICRVRSKAALALRHVAFDLRSCGSTGRAAAALVMRLGFGGLGDRFGHRRAVLVSLLAYAVVPFAVARLEPSLLWLYGAGMGLAHGVTYPTLTAFATERAPLSTRGRIIAVYSGSFSLGTSTGALTWGWVAAHAGYPAVFVSAGVAAGFAFLVLFLKTSARAHPSAHA